MQPVGGPRRILLVEDDVDVREALVQVLHFEGYETATASNGEEALERLASDPTPNVIVLDLMMPVMDGRQFRVAQMRDPAIANIPVIVISAAAYGEETVAGLGIAAYLRKPIEVEELLAAIARHCA